MDRIEYYHNDYISKPQKKPFDCKRWIDAYNEYCLELKEGKREVKFIDEIPRGRQIALDYLRETDLNFANQSVNKLFDRIQNLVIYLAEESNRNWFKDILHNLDKKTTIAIYFIGVNSFIKRHVNFLLEKHRLIILKKYTIKN